MIALKPYQPAYKDQVIALALRAWAGVFEKMAQEVPPFVYQAFYPDGWEARQRMDVAALLENEGERCWLATQGEQVVGMVGLRLHPEDQMGEIHILAVDPDHQRQGVGARLTALAEARIREAGMIMVMVETGGDSGHAPARAAYEAAGYQRWPVARYFKPLA